MNVYDMIAAQQSGREGTDVWMVGEQLKDIIRGHEELEKIVREDLEDGALKKCAGKLKERADQLHKERGGKSGCVCITPSEAEGIIRKFFGLPECGAKPSLQLVPPSVPKVSEGVGIPSLREFLRRG